TTASVEDVWRVLADGWSYSAWVVGTARIRAVETGFPAPGTTLHHSVGMWPLMLNDKTTVIDSEPNRRLVLQARAWPLGHAFVEITLTPTATGSTISIAEDAAGGPGEWLTIEPVRQPIIRARNQEALRRLAFLAEQTDSPS
ncbi:MAG: SRPBCC family protein, partial [Candidatus Nanopelagicales bacterium]